MESREAQAAKLLSDEQRLKYDSKDSARITEVSGILARDVVSLIAAIGEYDKELNSPVDEDSESRMRYARKAVVENYGFAQIALAKLAAVFRIDGEECFNKMINFLEDENSTLDMSGM